MEVKNGIKTSWITFLLAGLPIKVGAFFPAIE
jgi:hypothetical protein